jgi:hypothetical protein
LLVLLSMAGVVVAVAGLRSASGIVGPAFLVLILVITIHPLLAWRQRHRVPGWLAVVLTMLVAYTSLVALAAALVFSVARLATLLPSYQPQFTSLVDQFTERLGEAGGARDRRLLGDQRRDPVVDPAEVRRGRGGTVSDADVPVPGLLDLRDRTARGAARCPSQPVRQNAPGGRRPGEPLA